MFPGYAGHILYVDLTTGKARKEPLAPELVKRFIGGYGINNRLAYDLIPPGVEPLSPSNAIILGAGPFAGTLVPGAGKVLATTKFPLNGGFATAFAGGSFALRMKSLGYDHVVITGKASQPVYLKLSERGAELCDARYLWGQDVFDTTDSLRSLLEPCSIIAIGPAGERLVRWSIAVVDKTGTLGRGGLAAVMGSKNLKAVVAPQGTKEVRVADPARLLRLVNNLHERIMRWPGRRPLVEGGLTFMPQGSLEPAPEEVRALHRQTRSPLACPSCPLADKSRVKLDEGEYAGLVTYMTHLWVDRFPEVEMKKAHDRIVKLCDTLDKYGLCHMTFSYLLSLLTRLYRDGLITSKDTGGLEIKTDFETAMALAEMAAFRKGLGEILAEGPAGAISKIGRGAASYLEHGKGQSLILDPRLTGLGTMEFEQVVNPRGAHVASGGSPSYEAGRSPSDFARHGERMGIPPEALKRVVSSDSFNVARYTRYSEDWYSLFSCLSLCSRAFVNRFYHVNSVAELYAAVTGMEVLPADLMKAAERAWNLGRLLNVRVGFGRRDDHVPGMWFQPLEKNGKEYRLTDYYRTAVLTPKDLEGLLDDYYDERGYDPRSGAPGPEILAELGL